MAEQYHERKDDEREEASPGTPDQIDQTDQVDQQPHGSAEAEKRTHRTSGGHNTREQRQARIARAGNTAPRKPRKRSQAQRTGEGQDEPVAVTAGSIIQLPRRENAEAAARREADAALHELEAQGFTADEAVRIIHVSDRAATSHEAREAEATLRRLRFTRWLIERGVLDEFSA